MGKVPPPHTSSTYTPLGTALQPSRCPLPTSGFLGLFPSPYTPAPPPWALGPPLFALVLYPKHTDHSPCPENSAFTSFYATRGFPEG